MITVERKLKKNTSGSMSETWLHGSSDATTHPRDQNWDRDRLRILKRATY